LAHTEAVNASATARNRSAGEAVDLLDDAIALLGADGWIYVVYCVQCSQPCACA
jgi:hypothetical protein